MNTLRTRVRADELKTGDLLRQSYLDWHEGQPERKIRSLVVGATRRDVMVRGGSRYPVVRVTALDPGTNRAVVWVAVPGQRFTVIR